MGTVRVKQMSEWWKNSDCDEDCCAICGKPRSEWDTVRHTEYCPDCYDAVVDGLWTIKKNINYGYCEVGELRDAIHDLWEYAFPRGGKND